MCGEQGRGSPEAAVQLRYRLSDLKHSGSNILLVGTEALDAGCRRLLGQSGAAPRYRLFVTGDVAPARARERLSAVGRDAPRDAAAVVNWRTDLRGGAAADGATGEAGLARGASPSEADDGDGTLLREATVEGDDLRALGVEVTETIAAFEATADGLAPAELRLCFDSLAPLVRDYEGRDVRRFLLGVTEAVKRVDGMGHYHLPADYGSEAVASVSPLFDAVVEVRPGDGGAEQRWRIDDITTDWLPL